MHRVEIVKRDANKTTIQTTIDDQEVQQQKQIAHETGENWEMGQDNGFEWLPKDQATPAQKKTTMPQGTWHVGTTTSLHSYPCAREEFEERTMSRML